MEDALTWLRERAKSHKGELFAPFLIVLAGILIFFGLTSDIGFSGEITQHRYKVLIFSIVGAGFYTLIKVNRILFRELRKLEQEIVGLNSSLETTSQEKEGLTSEVHQKDKEIDQLRETVRHLFPQITGGVICQVERVQYFRERLHLSIKKDARDGWARGDEIRVIDTVVGDIMGVFEVTDIRENGYEAKSTHFVNSLWLGFIIQSGSETLPPDSVAILFPKESI